MTNEDKHLEGEVQNVFDTADVEVPDEPVPVFVEINGKKEIVGQAKLTKNGEYVHAEMDLKSDDEADIRELFGRGITGVSIADLAPDISEVEAQALMEFPAHDHKPVPHHDRRAPWCDFCGLDVDLKHPRKRVDNQPDLGSNGKPQGYFGTPANPIHHEGD